MPSPDTINVVVQLDHVPDAETEAIVASLIEHGFVLSERLLEIGVLTGSVAPASLVGLTSVPGVAAVELEQGDYHTQS